MAVSVARDASSRPRRQIQYAFGPAVRLAVGGSRVAQSHFGAEFGGALVTDSVTEPDLEVIAQLGSRPQASGLMMAGSGGYKTARWQLSLSQPDRRPLRAGLGLYGGPPSFVLSLVQGYLVEPLVAIVLAQAGFIALPSAGVVAENGAIVLMGRSRSGKSSVCARLVARGVAVLSDDQIIVDARGQCWPFPRRLRVYPDLRETAPAAWTTLPREVRRSLTLRVAARRLTRGYVAPSLTVSLASLGAVPVRAPLGACRFLAIERDPAVRSLTTRERHADWLLAEARASLLEQRGRLVALVGTRWRETIHAALEAELRTLQAALATAPITQLLLPREWDAPRAVAALDHYVVGLGVHQSAGTQAPSDS